MIHRLYVAAAAWTVVGLASGLYYRTLTHSRGFTDGMSTQLAVSHTHSLVLGTIVMLVWLALVKVFVAESVSQLSQAFWVWQAGLVLTVATMLVKGTLQVLGQAAADSSALAGISGLGHILLTVAFGLFFIGLKKGLDVPSGTGAFARTAQVAE